MPRARAADSQIRGLRTWVQSPARSFGRCGICSELDESDDENIGCSCQVYFTLTDGGEEGWGEQTKRKKKVKLEFF